MCVMALRLSRYALQFIILRYSTTASILLYFLLCNVFRAQIVTTQQLSKDNDYDIRKCPGKWSSVSEHENKRLSNLINNSLWEIRLRDEQHKVGCIPGDIMIGAIFPVHKRSGRISEDDELSYLLKCGTEIDFESIIAIQSFLFILDEINEL